MIKGISTDKYIITESNVVYLLDKCADLTLHFDFSNGFAFDYKLIFKSDSKNLKQRIENKVTGSKLESICYNFDNTLGTGTVEPIELATIDGKKLYILFWSFLLGSGKKKKQPRKVEYTVLLER